MTDKVDLAGLTVEQVQDWLIEKIAWKLQVASSEISISDFFDSFGLDSTEALVLANELESWLGFELETTALWYHPTIDELARYIVSAKDRLAAL